MRNVTFGLLALLLVAASAAALPPTPTLDSLHHGGDVNVDGDASAHGDGTAAVGLDGDATTERGDARGSLRADENGASANGGANGALGGLADTSAVDGVKEKLPPTDLPVETPALPEVPETPEDAGAEAQAGATKEGAGFAATFNEWMATLGAAFRGMFGF